MSRSNLQQALQRFIAPVRFSVPRQVTDLCPHLSVDQVDQLVVEAHTTGRVTFIGPPLKVRGAEHLYSLTLKEEEEGKQDRYLELAWGGCYRRRESYAHTEVPAAHTQMLYDYREQVADFAEVNWGNQLYWDRGRQLIHCMVCDPQRRTKHHFPYVVKQTMITLTETWQNLAFREDRYPLPQLVEHTLDLISSNRFINAELMGAQLPLAAYFCSYCGGGLGLNECNFCRRKVVCKKQARAAWPYPIPLRVVDELNWMADFELSPANAMKAYYGKWSGQDFQPPKIAVQSPREQRSIVLREDET